MRNKRIFRFLLVMIAFSSCVNDEFSEVDLNHHESSETFGAGFFVCNEGLFNFGNGELSYYNFSNNTLYNNVFYSANQFVPGDIPYSIYADNYFYYLVVNNSNKLWKIRREDFVVSGVIENLPSPRWMCINGTTAYISSFTESVLYCINLNDFTVSGTINTGRPLENLMLVGGELWGLHWSRYHSTQMNNKVLIINPNTNAVVDSVQTGIEPNSITLDKNGNVWILCSGGYLNEESARLMCFNPSDRAIVKELIFPNQEDYPLSITSNRSGDTLYYVNKNLYSYSIDSEMLNAIPFASGEGCNFYKVQALFQRQLLVVCDAGDYQNPGRILLYNTLGACLDTLTAGIIPGSIYEVIPVDK